MSDLEQLDAISYAFTQGYSLGHDHGRRAERLLVEHEARTRRAGEVVARLADFPEVDTGGTRREIAHRDRRCSI